MQLEAAEANTRAGQSGRSYTDQALRTARANLEEARRMVWDLRPEVLEDGTLADALGRLATSFAADTGVAAEFVVTGEPVHLPTTAEVVLLRVAQEALTNVRRHAAATRVTVTLSFLDTAVGLDVRDDGSGFDPARITPRADGRVGLQSMRERVTGLGGEFTIETAPGEGTAVAASLPVVVVVEPSPEATGALVARTAAKA
jgi:signal transduction histidine kinase